MTTTIIEFLAMLNPFALFIYLAPVMNDLSHKNFMRVLLQASLISFVIYVFFVLSGEFIFNKVLMIKYESFKVFGGVVIFSYAYLYIIKGDRALIHIKEDLDDLASEIALPFMVGAGSISLSIMVGFKYTAPVGIGLLAAILAVNFMVIIGLKAFKDMFKGYKSRIAFDKNMGIFMRLNGFFIGAIGIEMIFSGILALFFNK